MPIGAQENGFYRNAGGRCSKGVWTQRQPTWVTVATCWEKISNSWMSLGIPVPSSLFANCASLQWRTTHIQMMTVLQGLCFQFSRNPNGTFLKFQSLSSKSWICCYCTHHCTSQCDSPHWQSSAKLPHAGNCITSTDNCRDCLPVDERNNDVLDVDVTVEICASPQKTVQRLEMKLIREHLETNNVTVIVQKTF